MMKMKNHAIRIPIVTLGLLGMVAATSMLLPDQFGPEAAVATEPATIRLTGIVRDFRAAHPDFDVTPLSGYGHYAGNVQLSYTGEDRPVLAPGGFKVISQWGDRDANPIAPHLYAVGGALRLVEAPDRNKKTTIDSWDPSLGGYGGSNIAPAPTVQTGASMPALTKPADLGPSEGDVLFKGIVTISSNRHFARFETRQRTTINIDGNVTILCDELLRLGRETQINLLGNSTLRLYLGNGASINQGSMVNMDTWDPSRCLIYDLSGSGVRLSRDSSVCARLYSPDGTLQLDQNDHFYGTFVGKKLSLDQTTGFHAEEGASSACGLALDDTAGVKGPDDAGGITSASTFDEWFEDVLGTNLSRRHTISLIDNGAGVFEYTDDEFFPIDGRIFGNEGAAHNYFFTFELRTSFVYSGCTDQFFEFGGADDAWVYIDGKLAMDLGGILPGTLQYVPIDRLDLVDGKSYEFHLFYAQRQGLTASFYMRTNLPFESTGPIGIVTEGFD